MLERLDFLVRFWTLEARFRQLGDPLADNEQSELLSLMHVLASDGALPRSGAAPLARELPLKALRAKEWRVGDGLPAQLTSDCGFLAAELRLACVEGIVVACATPMRAGQRTVVRVADALSGVEYTLPCMVAWARRGHPSSMGLTLDGVASRSEFAVPTPGLWRSAGWNDVRPGMPAGALPH